jgi:hypothetical protein
VEVVMEEEETRGRRRRRIRGDGDEDEEVYGQGVEEVDKEQEEEERILIKGLMRHARLAVARRQRTRKQIGHSSSSGPGWFFFLSLRPIDAGIGFRV